MQRFFYSSLLVAGLVFAQEPSAFNAGGSTPKKTETQLLNEKFFNLSTQVKNLEESQEGLKSIFEGQVQRVQEVFNKIELVKGENNATLTEMKNQVDSNFSVQNDNIEKIKSSISALGALIKKTNSQMQEEITGLKNQILALEEAQRNSLSAQGVKSVKTEEGKIADSGVKESEVSGSVKIQEVALQGNTLEVDSVLKSLEEAPAGSISEKDNAQEVKEAKQESQKEEKKDSNQEKESVTAVSKQVESKLQDSSNVTENKGKEATTQSLLKEKPLADVFKQGEEFYKNKDFSQANEYLQFAVKGNYKPARGNYLLGEIAFEEKRYEDAIYYYKTSATRYDKADYMPRLMLNSAKSFSALKERENANRFLETLIALYPQSSEAKEAKKLIQ